MDRITSLLRANPVFELSEAAALGELIAHSAVIRYARNEVVLHEGEPAQRIFGLLGGRVKVYHVSPIGEEVTLKLFGAPALFGEAEALGCFAYQEYVRALEPAEILIMPIGAFVHFLKQDHSGAFRMLVDVAKRLGVASYNQRSLAFFPSTMRLANYLLDYGEWTNPGDAAEWLIDLTQDQMAAAIGVTRRSVAKDISGWKQEGVLRRRPSGYVIADRAALARYCDPDRLTICYNLKRTYFF